VSVADLLGQLLQAEVRSSNLLHMVPSENTLSPAARSAYSGTLQSRYSFGDGAAWPAMEWFESIEQAAAAELATLLECHHLSIRPLSGMNAMTVALSAFAPACVVSVPVSAGGHAVTAQMARRLGATVHNLPLLDDEGGIDVPSAARLIARLPQPVLVYLDQYCAVRPLRVDDLATNLPPGTTVHYDASHIMGLVVGGVVPNPLKDGASSLGGSLHKSFPGPHRGVLAASDAACHQQLEHETSAWVSHHHPGHTIALAITLEEMRGHWPEYAGQVVSNARAFAANLAERGIPVYGSRFGYTECHQVFIDIEPVMDPAQAAHRLLDAGIRVNAIDIPQLGRVGLRAGLQELTRKGLNEAGATEIAGIVGATIDQRTDVRVLQKRSRAIVEDLSWDAFSARHGGGPVDR